MKMCRPAWQSDIEMEGEADDDQGSGSEGSKCEEAFKNKVERAISSWFKACFSCFFPCFFHALSSLKQRPHSSTSTSGCGRLGCCGAGCRAPLLPECLTTEVPQEKVPEETPTEPQLGQEPCVGAIVCVVPLKLRCKGRRRLKKSSRWASGVILDHVVRLVVHP